MIWVTFFVSALFIVLSGIRLSYYGDIIAEKSGMGRTIVGLLLISFATSLPEMVTSIRAASLGSADMVLGNMLGSNLFNLVLFVMIDFSLNKKNGYATIGSKNLRTASLSLLFLAVVMLSLVLKVNFQSTSVGTGFFHLEFGLPVISYIGVDSVLLVLLYVLVLRKFVFDGHEEDEEEEANYEGKSLKEGVIGFLICGAIIVVAGLFLTDSADKISKIKVGGAALGGTFVGSLFMAIVTSLPELVATIGALRLKAYNMAAGNILGSNMFNLIIVFFGDLFYKKGALLANVGNNHLITGVAVLMMTLFVVSAAKPGIRKRWRIGTFSQLLLLVYVGTQLILFMIRR